MHPKRKGTRTYYEQYARWLCNRNCKPAIQQFERVLNWNRVAVRGWNSMLLSELIDTIGFCRNCTVHCGGKVKHEEVRKLAKEPKRFVKSCIRKSVDGRFNLILPDKAVCDGCIEAIASYGYSIYVLLAEKCDMRIEYKPGGDAERVRAT